MNPGPETAFRGFLDDLASSGWIQSYAWTSSSDSVASKKALHPAFSRSHKDDDAGTAWRIEIESAPGSRSGVDLEYLNEERPLFQNRDWLERRLKIPSSALNSLSARELLEEWSYREASFKALYPFNEGVVLSDFGRAGPDAMALRKNEEEHSFRLRGTWQGRWFLAVARREGTEQASLV